jgi:hypothetical protein
MFSATGAKRKAGRVNDSLSLDPARLENVKHLDGGSVEFYPLVSFFKNAYENLPTDIPAAQFIASIKGNEHKKLVEEIRERFQRALSRGVEYSQAKRTVDTQKKKLPCVSFAGVLPMRDKKATPKFTGLFQADLDLLGDRLSEIRGTLRDDPHVYSLFVSPTGEGLKAIYRVPICKNAEEYKAAFAAVSARVQDLTGVEIDKLEDFTRLCFASHDPDACLNPNAVELPVDFSQPAEEQTPSPPSAEKSDRKTIPFAVESRRAIAERILGAVEWQSDTQGECQCPGEAHHTTGEKPHECQIHLDRVPTIHCVHKSCESAVAEKNHRLRSEIGKAEKAAAPIWTPDNSNSDRLTLRRPDEILAMTFDDSDRILGDRILASGQSLVISGQGGIGKSRLLLQMAVACLGGLPFIGFETRGQELKWLILQAENSNRRLKDDLAALRLWIGPDHWPQVNAGLTIHTLETDLDGFLSVSSPKAQLAIKAAVESTMPDVVVFDSLYNFGAGNLNSDEDMAETLLTLARLAKAGNPRRAIVILHHAGTGRAGAARAIGFDRSSFGRNSKVLHSWTRAQLNIAPGSPDEDAVFVVSCGKISNGKEFPMFAIRLHPDTMIYAPDETFDLSQWQSEVTGKKADEPTMSPERVGQLCKPAMPKAELSKAIQADCGCGRQMSYKHINRAERRGKIKWNPKAEHFNPV